MALKVVTMAELRSEVLMEAERTGLTVTEICRRYGISRQTYYRYRRRYLAEGLARARESSLRGDTPRRPTGLEPGLEPADRQDRLRWGHDAATPLEQGDIRATGSRPTMLLKRPDQKGTLEQMSPHPTPQQPRARHGSNTRIAHSTLSEPHAHATSCRVSTCMQESR